jgi:hypothetical protein
LLLPQYPEKQNSMSDVMTDGKKQGEPSRVVCLPNRAASVNWRVFSQKCPTQFFNMPVFKESVAVIDLTHVHEPMLARARSCNQGGHSALPGEECGHKPAQAKVLRRGDLQEEEEEGELGLLPALMEVAAGW